MREGASKIVARDQLRVRLAEHKCQGQRVVFANGCFDILVVGVNSDSSVCHLKGPGRPILDENARAQLVAAFRCVDYVVLFAEPNVESLLEEVRPDVHAKGTDYTAETVPERAVAIRLGIRVAIVGDPQDHSTRELLESIRKAPHA